MPLRVLALNDNRIAVRGIDPMMAYCLHELPAIVNLREQPGLRPRFFPDLVETDESINRDWHETVDADLHHLLESAIETVTRDLTGLDEDQVSFPSEHLPAWMSALNQARLVLGELHAVTEADMHRTGLDMSRPRDKALFEIHLLGYLLQLLVEHNEES